MESKKYNKLVNITKKKQTHRYSEQTSDYQWGRVLKFFLDFGTSLVVQWLRRRASTEGGEGSIPELRSCTQRGVAKKKKKKLYIYI